MAGVLLAEEVGHAGAVLVQTVLRHTQYWFGLVVLVAFFATAATESVVAVKRDGGVIFPKLRGPNGKPLPINSRKKRAEPSRPVFEFGKRAVLAFRILSVGVVASYAASSVALIVHAFVYENANEWSRAKYWWWTGDSAVVYLGGLSFLYLYFLITLFEWGQTPQLAHLVAWTISLVAEAILLVTTLVRALGCDHVDPATSAARFDQVCVNGWEKLDLALYVTRVVLLLGLTLLYCALWLSATRGTEPVTKLEASEPDETAPLLRETTRSYGARRAKGSNGRRSSHSQANNRSNGSVSTEPARKEEQTGYYRPDKLPKKGWWEYCSGYTIFFPYLWPKESIHLQLTVALCFTLLVIQRVVNVMVPLQVGKVTDALLPKDDQSFVEALSFGNLPFGQLLILGGLWLLQGSGGLLASFRSLLWIEVSQYSYRGLTTAAFEHVHSLSLDFHLGKRTGEVLSALNKGASINQFLEQVTFNVVPMFFDLLLAIYFFWYQFGPTFAILVGVNTFWYLYLTVQMAQTRADQRREMTNADREEEAVKNDSITSYETVKYFNAEPFEFKRYREAIDNFQAAEAQVSQGTNRMSIAQAIVYNGGRISASILGAWLTGNHVMSVGNFTTLLAYLAQLQGPLNFFGTFYRSVQQAMISGERLLELFKIQPSVTDAEHARPLSDCEGKIKWTDVCFAYADRKPALSGINFECKPGTTTAFVGESGGGKSTLFRLMFRYYNCSDGKIELDGHDVKDLTIDSVRRSIGVVPQDTTLFNDTLMFNLKYANGKASDEMVFDACRAASIHDRIMSFPDGYNTMVGERGLRLSGGEKQRVAIARTILKNPKVIMLDEATSALDTNTEQQIQDKLGSLGCGRTLLIIAHRLSTITHADQIIVLHGGHVVEKGTHEDLLAKNGRYKTMWDKQIRAERAAEEARVASRKAQKLMKKANIGKQPIGANGYHSLESSTVLQAEASGQEDKSTDAGCTSEDSSSSSASSDAESTHEDRTRH